MWTTAERATTISLAPPSTPRLRLQPPRAADSPRTPLDGAWWPRSADPVAELPGLILALQAHGPNSDHRPITHLMLPVADWDSHPRRLRVDGPDDTRVVRLSWFDTLPAGLLTAIWPDGQRIDLLTVPAHTHHQAAHSAMDLAAHPANHLRTAELLTALSVPLSPETPPITQPATQAATEDAWETEGGRLREHQTAL